MAIWFTKYEYPGYSLHTHLGSSKLLEIPPSVVDEVTADGHELEFILENIQGIPCPKKPLRMVTWYGDDAKFIAKHWFQLQGLRTTECAL